MYHFYHLVCGSSRILHPWAEDLPVQDLHSNLALGYSKNILNIWYIWSVSHSWKLSALNHKRRDWDVLNLANDSHRTSVLTRRKLRDLTWMTSNIEISFNILVSLSIILNRLFMKKGFILLQNMWEVREPAIILPIYNWADFFR